MRAHKIIAHNGCVIGISGILMRMKNLPYGQEDDLSAAPGTIKPQLEEPVLNELRRYSPALATDSFHLIGVVPYSKTLSAPRTLDVARVKLRLHIRERGGRRCRGL